MLCGDDKVFQKVLEMYQELTSEGIHELTGERSEELAGQENQELAGQGTHTGRAPQERTGYGWTRREVRLTRVMILSIFDCVGY